MPNLLPLHLLSVPRPIGRVRFRAGGPIYNLFEVDSQQGPRRAYWSDLTQKYIQIHASAQLEVLPA